MKLKLGFEDYYQQENNVKKNFIFFRSNGRFAKK